MDAQVAMNTAVSVSRDQRRSNRRIGLTLGAIALVFFVGCIVRMALLGR
jgi:hypothetical protein